MPFSSSFPFFCFLFFVFFFVSLLFVVLRVPFLDSFFVHFLSFRLVVFRLILVSPSSLLLSLPCFPWWRILLFCYFVSALHPPRAHCEPQVCVFPLRAIFFLCCVADVDLSFFFFSSCPFSISIWPSFVFILSFSCGYYAVSSV